MKTQGEIESAICDGITRFEQEFMGRGPKDIRAHLIDDVLFVRLKGVLTAAEQHLVKSLPAEKGRDLLKQVRVASSRNRAAAFGDDDQGYHRNGRCEHASRHQHRYWRRSYAFHSDRTPHVREAKKK